MYGERGERFKRAAVDQIGALSAYKRSIRRKRAKIRMRQELYAPAEFNRDALLSTGSFRCGHGLWRDQWAAPASSPKRGIIHEPIDRFDKANPATNGKLTRPWKKATGKVRAPTREANPQAGGCLLSKRLARHKEEAGAILSINI